MSPVAISAVAFALVSFLQPLRAEDCNAQTASSTCDSLNESTVDDRFIGADIKGIHYILSPVRSSTAALAFASPNPPARHVDRFVTEERPHKASGAGPIPLPPQPNAKDPTPRTTETTGKAPASGAAAPAAVRRDLCPAADGRLIRQLVRAIAQEEGLDPDFADAVAWVESRYGAARYASRAGALGVMQLMPRTAEELGVADRCDHEANIRGGVRYLKELTLEFEDPLLALAAYNAGPSRVFDSGGIPDFIETQRYVARVLNRWRLTAKVAALSRKTAGTAPTDIASAQPGPAHARAKANDTTTSAWKDGHVIEMD